MFGYLFKGAIGTNRLRYTAVEGWHDNFTIYLHAPFLSCLIQFLLFDGIGSTSSSLEVLCNKYMMSKICSIKEVYTYYKQCKELDSFIDNSL